MSGGREWGGDRRSRGRGFKVESHKDSELIEAERRMVVRRGGGG
jgi:hypothetical protein